MKPAQELAKLATQIGQTADLLKPQDNDPYATACRLAIFHLRSAATQLRSIAEALAQKEENT